MYLPNINLVWASMPGNAPKRIIVKGKHNHWKKILICDHLVLSAGRGGKSFNEYIADVSIPIIAKFIITRVKNGKLAASAVI